MNGIGTGVIEVDSVKVGYRERQAGRGITEQDRQVYVDITEKRQVEG